MQQIVVAKITHVALPCELTEKLTGTWPPGQNPAGAKIQFSGVDVSSSLAVGFSKSLITSSTNLAGYPDRMKDCLIACTSSCQFVAIRFAL